MASTSSDNCSWRCSISSWESSLLFWLLPFIESSAKILIVAWRLSVKLVCPASLVRRTAVSVCRGCLDPDFDLPSLHRQRPAASEDDARCPRADRADGAERARRLALGQ